MGGNTKLFAENWKHLTSLSKQVICESRRRRNDYLSNVFTRNKKDRAKCTILNLKQFNTHITYCCFKMESINPSH